MLRLRFSRWGMLDKELCQRCPGQLGLIQFSEPGSTQLEFTVQSETP